MKTEIVAELERRWLVHEIDQKIFKRKPRFIEQAYLEGSSDTRVRITDGKKAVLTSKTGRGRSRKEKNLATDVSTARFLMESTPYQIVKRRFDCDGWEVDRFEGPLTGIVMAEFEAPTAEALDAVTLPPWIKSATEVTESVTNRHLSRLAANLADGETIKSDQLTKRVPSIVLTGCPCSGKSSLMRILSGTEDGGLFSGRFLHCVPEVATIVINQVGVTPPLDDSAKNRKFQRGIYRVQRAFEEVSQLHAQRTGKRGILMDRGTVDGAAYMDGGLEEFQKTIRTNMADEYARYDAVFILMPAPREIFERDKGNNKARGESYEEAMALHLRITSVWRNHPQAIYVDGATWEAKVANARAMIESVLKRA